MKYHLLIKLLSKFTQNVQEVLHAKSVYKDNYTHVTTISEKLKKNKNFKPNIRIFYALHTWIKCYNCGINTQTTKSETDENPETGSALDKSVVPLTRV